VGIHAPPAALGRHPPQNSHPSPWHRVARVSSIRSGGVRESLPAVPGGLRAATVITLAIAACSHDSPNAPNASPPPALHRLPTPRHAAHRTRLPDRRQRRVPTVGTRHTITVSVISRRTSPRSIGPPRRFTRAGPPRHDRPRLGRRLVDRLLPDNLGARLTTTSTRPTPTARAPLFRTASPTPSLASNTNVPCPSCPSSTCRCRI